MTTLDPALGATLARIQQEFYDDRLFCAESLVILDNKGRLVPLRWNPAQEKLAASIDKQRAAGLPVRQIILKSRRAGFSTGIAAHLFKQTAFIDGQGAIVVAHEKKAARNLFDMYDCYQSNYRPFGRTIALPPLKSRQVGAEDALLQWANGSRISIATAKNVDFSRSFNFRRVHLSEYAFYPNIRQFMAALVPTVPDDPDTWIIKESTANSYNDFYNEWEAAQEGKSAYLPLFFGCFDDPENIRRLPTDPNTYQRTMSDEEWALQQKYNLALEQIHWRRVKIHDDYNGDEAMFDQEYPHSAEVAFLVSGRVKFNPKLFLQMPISEPLRGGITVEQVGTRTHTRFVERPNGELLLYQPPEPTADYVGGCDPSKGIDINEGIGTPDPDYSEAHVFKRLGDGVSSQVVFDQAAVLRDRIIPPILAQYLYDLGKYYNWVYWVIEVEPNGGNGAAVIAELRRLNYPAECIHRMVKTEGGRSVAHHGYHISSATRPLLMSTWERLLLEKSVVLRDKITVQQHRTFVIHPDGKVAAQKGAHDDAVFGAMYGGIAGLHAPRLMTAREAVQQTEPVQYAMPLRERLRRSV